MSEDTRRIGEILAPIIRDAIGLARLQTALAELDPTTRKVLVMLWWERGVVTAEEAELLIEFNALEAA